MSDGLGEDPVVKEPQQDPTTVAGGFGLGLLLQLIQLPFIPLLFGWALIGVSQLLYIVPAIIMSRNAGYGNRAKGLIIAACAVLLLNATCMGLLLNGNLGRIGG